MTNEALLVAGVDVGGTNIEVGSVDADHVVHRRLKAPTPTGGPDEVLAAREIGHVVVQAGGALCTCGRRGYAEAYAGRRSMSGVVSAMVDAGWPTGLYELQEDEDKSKLTSKVWARSLDDGDELAVKVFTTGLRRWPWMLQPRPDLRFVVADLIAVGLIASAVAAILRAHRPDVGKLDLRDIRVLPEGGATVPSDLRAMAHADGVTVTLDVSQPDYEGARASSEIHGLTRAGIGEQAAWPLSERLAS